MQWQRLGLGQKRGQRRRLQLCLKCLPAWRRRGLLQPWRVRLEVWGGLGAVLWCRGCCSHGG